MPFDGCSDWISLAATSCSATAPRRRRDEWIVAGCSTPHERRRSTPAIGRSALGHGILEPSESAVDSCITEAPRGGEKAGKSPVDRTLAVPLLLATNFRSVTLEEAVGGV